MRSSFGNSNIFFKDISGPRDLIFTAMEAIHHRQSDDEISWGITKLTHVMGDENARGDLSLEEDRDE